jgi:hypothetical protein
MATCPIWDAGCIQQNCQARTSCDTVFNTTPRTSPTSMYAKHRGTMKELRTPAEVGKFMILDISIQSHSILQHAVLRPLIRKLVLASPAMKTSETSRKNCTNESNWTRKGFTSPNLNPRLEQPCACSLVWTHMTWFSTPANVMSH